MLCVGADPLARESATICSIGVHVARPMYRHGTYKEHMSVVVASCNNIIVVHTFSGVSDTDAVTMIPSIKLFLLKERHELFLLTRELLSRHSLDVRERMNMLHCLCGALLELVVFRDCFDFR